MKIILNNSPFKYEIEAIVKLFFPAVTFDFLYDSDENEGDFCRLTRTEDGEISLFSEVSLEGKTASSKEKLSSVSSLKEQERVLCAMLFLNLRELTGISPKWGTLTGIRPVKRVNGLLQEGKSKEEIFARLQEAFYVSEEKCRLAYLTAMTQKDFLSVKPDSFSLYVSIPFCPTRCAYCSFVSHSIAKAKNLIPQYLRRLCDELEFLGTLTSELGLTLDTVYFGGGTPTSLEAEQLDILMTAVKKSFNLSTVREYTVEAGRPDTITPEKLRVIKNRGATRISINPQTMEDSVLEIIGRKHTSAQTIEAFKMARAEGFDNINMDLIAGLPSDTVEGFRRTLEKVMSLSPEDITVHTLSLKRSSSLFQEHESVMDNPADEMVSYAGETLTTAGYMPYYLYRQKNTLGNLENVGFAKKGFESLYNIFIMEEMQTIIGAGAAASTKLVDPKNGKLQRVYHYKFPYEYISRFDELLLKQQEIKRFYQQIEKE